MKHIEALKKVVGADIAKYSNESQKVVIVYRWTSDSDTLPFATANFERSYFEELIEELSNKYHWAVKPNVNRPLAYDENLMDVA